MIAPYSWPLRQGYREKKTFSNTKFQVVTQQSSIKQSRRPAKIGQNQSIWTKWWISHEISFVRTVLEKSLRVWMSLPCSIPKSYAHIITTYKLEQNDLPDPYFCPPYSRQFVEFVKKNKNCRKSQGFSNSVVIFFVWKPRHAGKLEPEFHVFANKRRNNNIKKKCVITCVMRWTA